MMRDMTSSLRAAVYRDKNDGQWYWTLAAFNQPIGPFPTKEAAREDLRNVTGSDDQGPQP